MRGLCYVVVICAAIPVAKADVTTLVEWNFDNPDDLQPWAHPNHIQELHIADGALCGRIMDWDPFVRGPQFEIRATPYQRVELRLKTDCGGSGQLFWTNTTQSPYGGFAPEKCTTFDIVGDGAWHVYQVYPFWHREGKIILLRLDLPRPNEVDNGQKTFALDYLRIVDLGQPDQVGSEAAWDFTNGAQGWQGGQDTVLEPTNEGLRLATGDHPQAFMISGALRSPLRDRIWLHVEMKVDVGSAGYVRWVSSDHAGLQTAKFPIKADGRFHGYNLDMSSHASWSGDALLLGLQPTNAAGATATIRTIALGLDPLGPAELECVYFGLDDAINRAGRSASLVLHLVNRGGTGAAAGAVQIAALQLPDGVTIKPDAKWRELPALEPFEPVVYRVSLQADRPVQGQVVLQLTGPGAPTQPLTAQILIAPSLQMAHVDYVPEPQPVASRYDIGALYFPGWPSAANWQPIQTLGPERKPVLGWYDEGNPECVDWQIKWAVEHGISFFLVDWYWNAGSRHLEHWIQAFQKARYRRYLKWAMMWANHNPPGSHSEADMRRVARFWVDNYFGMPEYMRLDDKPVVMIWSPENIRRDLGGTDGGRRALDIARQVAREAGYKGIYFIAMKWPEASTDPALIRRLADDGYDMTSIYHYMHHGDRAEDPRHFPFQLVADSSDPHWKSWHEAGILPFLPNLSTGWDSRPWHGDRATVIYDRSVPLFRKICEDAKRFANETGVNRLVLAPLNEWGEGSYAEPNKEFGFGMYDAVRDVFCQRPQGGWPPNLTPQDVGLGPYDFPAEQRGSADTWTFEHSAEGFAAAMGVSGFRQENGALHFETTSSDPALVVSVYNAEARKYRFVRIRMRADTLPPGEKAQLFWSTVTSPVSEANSSHFELAGDGQFHDYVVPVHENSRWRGKIASLRFDPCNRAGVKITIDEVRLTRDNSDSP